MTGHTPYCPHLYGLYAKPQVTNARRDLQLAESRVSQLENTVRCLEAQLHSKTSDADNWQFTAERITLEKQQVAADKEKLEQVISYMAQLLQLQYEHHQSRDEARQRNGSPCLSAYMPQHL